MEFPKFFKSLLKSGTSAFTKDKIPFIIGGVVAGVLGLWVVGKISAPWVKPVLKTACMRLLDIDSARGALDDRITNVEAVRVKLGPISRRIVTVGKLLANESVMIRSEMAGKIRQIAFKEGDNVQKDDILIQFDDEELQAELKLAEAELTLRESDFERSSSLRAKNIESAKKFDEVRAQRDSAKAKVDLAKAKLEKTVIKAPFSGTIGLIEVSAGAFVQGAQDLVRLVDNDPIKVDFNVPEKHLHDVGVGQIAEIRLDGFPDEVHRATVEAIDSAVEHQSHSIKLKASAPNADNRLRAGLFASVSLIIGEKSDAIVVPESAVAREGDIEYVWVIQSGKAGRRRVITGTRESAQIEIIHGIRPDELVVTAGQIKLYNGAAVHITNLSQDLALDEEVVADTKSQAGENKSPEQQPKGTPEESQKEQPKEAPQAKSDTEKAQTPPEESKTSASGS
ncbi:MAG TPA: efflux RND transporter periplasmic adaptor subunit, partial [Candidatus Nitrosotenuis sp.]|nr:efflux RND transporter periplasmic adaptor subunit [Candidatus Nitrosotenuis sp.]